MACQHCQHPRLLHRWNDGEELFCPDCGDRFVEVENQVVDLDDDCWWEDFDMVRPIVDDPYPPLLLSEIDL